MSSMDSLSGMASDLKGRAEPYERPAPESFFKIRAAEISPKLREPVRLSNGMLTLSEAIHATLPFRVGVQVEDQNVNLNQPYPIRTSQDMLVADFLEYLEGLSNYKINFNPDTNLIKIKSYVTQRWNLAHIASASISEIQFGTADGEDDDGTTDDEGSGSDVEVEISNQFLYGEQTPWEVLVQQANCVLQTLDCQQEITTIGDDLTGQNFASARTRAWVQADQRSGLLIASASPQAIRRLDEWLSPLQKDTSRLVGMEIMILDIANNDTKTKLFNILLENGEDSGGLLGGRQADTRLQAGGLTIDAAFALRNNSLDILLQNFTRDQNVEVLHKTNLIAANGGTSRINSVQTFFYAGGQEVIPGDATNQQLVSSDLEEAEVGLELAITPQILDDERILITIVPTLSSLVRFENIVSGGVTVSRAPVISVTNLISKGVARSGQAISIGGLSTSQLSKQISRPFGLQGTIGDWVSSGGKTSSQREIVVVVLPQEIG